MFKNVLFLIVFYLQTERWFQVNGHGTLWEPIERSSVWRINSSYPVNKNDSHNDCGGFKMLHQTDDHQCGVCGDPITDPTPRDNELGGKYGQGYISRIYTSGQVIPVQVNITLNHMGYFKFDLCNMDITKEESDTCFQQMPLKLEDGKDMHDIIRDEECLEEQVKVKLPENMVCEHCVLRWEWKTGKDIGKCAAHTEHRHEICGNYEMFRSCSDIRIIESQEIKTM